MAGLEELETHLKRRDKRLLEFRTRGMVWPRISRLYQ